MASHSWNDNSTKEYKMKLKPKTQNIWSCMHCWWLFSPFTHSLLHRNKQKTKPVLLNVLAVLFTSAFRTVNVVCHWCWHSLTHYEFVTLTQNDHESEKRKLCLWLHLLISYNIQPTYLCLQSLMIQTCLSHWPALNGTCPREWGWEGMQVSLAFVGARKRLCYLVCLDAFCTMISLSGGKTLLWAFLSNWSFPGWFFMLMPSEEVLREPWTAEDIWAHYMFSSCTSS